LKFRKLAFIALMAWIVFQVLGYAPAKALAVKTVLFEPGKR
jgi:hypothetical protein